jgi:hypothetical protein
VRKHWHEVDYWRWVWHRRVRSEAKIAIAAVLFVLLLGGGWFAADRLTGAHASVSSTDAFLLETTVRRVVTVREHGKVVRWILPVVRRVYLRRETAIALRTKYEKQVVTAPGTVRIVRRVVTTYVPTVKNQRVTVTGKLRTVVRTQVVPTTRVETQIQIQTQTQTIRKNRTITRTQTRTLPPQTVTRTQIATVTQTETKTVSQTVPVTVTETQTVTVSPTP